MRRSGYCECDGRAIEPELGAGWFCADCGRPKQVDNPDEPELAAAYAGMTDEQRKEIAEQLDKQREEESGFRKEGAPAGRYDLLAGKVKEIAQAELLALFVVNGRNGTSYTVITEDPSLLTILAQQLEKAAANIRARLLARKEAMN